MALTEGYAGQTVEMGYEWACDLGQPHMTLHGVVSIGAAEFGFDLTPSIMESIMQILDRDILEENILAMPDGYWLPAAQRRKKTPQKALLYHQGFTIDEKKGLPWRQDWYRYLQNTNVPAFAVFRTPEQQAHMAPKNLTGERWRDFLLYVMPEPIQDLAKIQNSPLTPSVRMAILRRDSFRCRLCGVAASDSPLIRLEVDHITPRIDGGSNDPSNLWTLCFACNRGKGTQRL